ncbi:MAG: four helix bundle protein [Patescibacteria group bacterium]
MKNDRDNFRSEFKCRIYCWIIRLIKFLDDLSKDTITQRIVDQLFRSGSSIGANYVEAQASSSKKDFTNFFHYALKSANESKFWLILLRDIKRADSQKTEELLKELVEIANILASSLITIKSRK